jgi:UTP--glucose-1-phosphate uridylyltransferase
MPKEMLPVVDKPLIQYAVEEAAEAGIEQFIFVTGRGKGAIENHFDHSFELEQTLRVHSKQDALDLTQEMLQSPGSFAYVRQQEPAGLGHAVWCARHLVPDEPVAILLADDLIYTSNKAGCLKQMIDVYQSDELWGGNLLALMEVSPEDTESYGMIQPGTRSVYQDAELIEVLGLVEKPRPIDAPSRLAVVGRYIIEPGVFSELDRGEAGAGGEIQLTDSLAHRVGQAPFYGLMFDGERFDCGAKLGFLSANIALALTRPELNSGLRDWIKARLGD